MRSNFRFPRSAMVSMSLVFLSVVIAIEKGRELAVSVSTNWPGLAGFFVMVFAVMFIAGLTACAILFAFKQSGVQRLANIQTRQARK